jgi:hypothetical protein
MLEVEVGVGRSGVCLSPRGGELNRGRDCRRERVSRGILWLHKCRECRAVYHGGIHVSRLVGS